MKDNPPETAKLDEEQKRFLLSAAEHAKSLMRMVWRAYYAAKYNDTKTALYSLNEARIHSLCVQKNLTLLPPTIDFPTHDEPARP